MQATVLGVNVFRRKDGTLAARVVVASTPQNPNVRGLLAAEFEALPEVADSMKVLPGIYKLDLEFPVSTGFGKPNEVRPRIVGAHFIAPLVPEKKVQQGA